MPSALFLYPLILLKREESNQLLGISTSILLYFQCWFAHLMSTFLASSFCLLILSYLSYLFSTGCFHLCSYICPLISGAISLALTPYLLFYLHLYINCLFQTHFFYFVIYSATTCFIKKQQRLLCIIFDLILNP